MRLQSGGSERLASGTLTELSASVMQDRPPSSAGTPSVFEDTMSGKPPIPFRSR